MHGNGPPSQKNLVGRIGSEVRVIASFHIDSVYFACSGPNFHYIMAPFCHAAPLILHFSAITVLYDLVMIGLRKLN